MRPLQIMHGVPEAQATPQVMAKLKEAGLGGIVCNVSFSEYLRSEAHWATLARVVESCRQAGLRVWIYDEEGYPSAAAGGLVLKAHPELEAQVLAYDPSAQEPFHLRRAYEFTHASNNVFAQRRYPNLIEDAATPAFIEQTHQAYWRKLEKHFGSTIEAFFTDEPSLMAVHLGDLKARAVDPPDPKAKLLATVPWCSDMPQRYRERYGQDLLAARRSLFAGNEEADRVVRRRFWALVADLTAQRYFARLQDWCARHRVASSGHMLWEEQILHHVPLYGNYFKSLACMDVPGLDMLSSDPMSAVRDQGWLAAELPMSAALLRGQRMAGERTGRVMTEVSDYSQGGKSDLASMRATAGWQAALGVTEFTLYYDTLARFLGNPPDALALRDNLRQYCDFVGRVNALTRAARPAPNVLLYYPIHDLWAEYLPVAERLDLERQSERARRLARSFGELGRRLLTTQTSFALADHELLASSQVRGGGLWIEGSRFEAVVLPAGVELPEAAAAVVNRFQAAGGCVLRDTAPVQPLDLQPLDSRRKLGKLQPACDHVVAGQFLREGRSILVLVNVGGADYTGSLGLPSGEWILADPATGAIGKVTAEAVGIALTLPVRTTLVLVGPKQGP